MCVVGAGLHSGSNGSSDRDFRCFGRINLYAAHNYCGRFGSGSSNWRIDLFAATDQDRTFEKRPFGEFVEVLILPLGDFLRWISPFSTRL